MRRANFRRSSARQGADASEMLNTDIMRFFAIMALCLMAIFALVQTATDKSDSAGPTIVEESGLHREIQALESQKEELQQQLSQLKRQVVSLENAVVKKQKFVQQEIEYAGQKLTAAKKALTEKRLQSARQKSSKAKVSLVAADKVIGQLSSATAKPPVKNVKKEATRGKGFQLRFADEQTLFTLIEAHKVDFYMIADRQSWSGVADNSRIRFVKKRPTGRFYQMATESVPNRVVAAGRYVVSHHGRDGLIYGVILPLILQRQIEGCMQKGDGGVLTILQNGQLRCSDG